MRRQSGGLMATIIFQNYIGPVISSADPNPTATFFAAVITPIDIALLHFDLSRLSPDELAALKQAAQSERSNLGPDVTRLYNLRHLFFDILDAIA
jgi:hypothetical protein